MTPPTRDLAEIVLLDSAKIAVQDDKQVLFDKTDATHFFTQFKTANYNTPFTIANFKVTFHDAGHILGSASIEIEDTSATSGVRKVVFSGDLGNSPQELLYPTETISSSDVVVMESTYGDQIHPQEDPAETLYSEISAVEANGGTLLIPAFSLEKTQEILHMLKRLKLAKKVRTLTPVFLDSPMAIRATYVYVNHKQLLNENIRNEFKQGSPFEFPGLQVIESRFGNKQIAKHEGAKIIVAGSGMMSGGKIVAHAAHYLPFPSTRLFLVGYQGEETLGREISEGAKKVEIHGKFVPIRATVNQTRAMSSHADQGQLLSWLKAINGVRKVVLTHGEEPQRGALSEKIKSATQISQVVLPHLNDEVVL